MVPLTAVYLYCVVRSTRRPAVTRVPPGIPGATRPVVEGLGRSLWIVVADAPLDVYGPRALEPRLSDLEWVSEIAVGHEAVVEHFARLRNATVVPMKLFTMFSTVDKAASEIRAGRAAIDRAVRHIVGCEEWGIRVTRAAGAAVRVGAGKSRGARRSPAVTTGAAFLAAQKAARDAEKTARTDAVTASEHALAALQRLARDTQRRERRAEPGTNPPIVEAAFLVKASARGRFKSEARKQAAACAAAGAQMILTGPWPAYNFVGGRT